MYISGTGVTSMETHAGCPARGPTQRPGPSVTFAQKRAPEDVRPSAARAPAQGDATARTRERRNRAGSQRRASTGNCVENTRHATLHKIIHLERGADGADASACSQRVVRAPLRGRSHQLYDNRSFIGGAYRPTSSSAAAPVPTCEQT
ncbi:hypothetical protein EVAR_61825_1 [Eumeta japonica]|uniref:Uncharacterized protein n=1 Tax=Eumeta variegata TaxID=151549 RepID=A0A4C1YW05_EUMVA|nr:hypothetical protein EVAR_61825_1 [Eumeta japonica]